MAEKRNPQSMPKEITPLSELQVKAIKPKVKAGGTLDVDKTARLADVRDFTSSAARPHATRCLHEDLGAWRARLNGKRVEFGLGSYATRASTKRKKASGKPIRLSL